ncbi:KTSC domain-containing protein [Chitinophaga silvatica]|uniref:KTSC domain-containing protein n=1 Tax=Chitinophaga silvatica TaxID=2282649 RepID=A0A3E1YDX3_9BACT|nr:KTSC domain-containing protein [Chitinophaga silvatica]RFS24732.1 KTSC domain-containing protein [Chitinophaga silvatica]
MPSSVVAHMVYKAKTHTLRIVFVSGMIYDYIQVPEEIYLEMKSASSKGTFLNKKIKGFYQYKKVN